MYPSSIKSATLSARQLLYASCATLLATATLLAHTAEAKTTCDTSLGDTYPYCVSVPDDAGSDSMPTVLFLQGRGARGSASQVETLSTYDGFGKLVNQYNSGNKGEAQTLAATKFITIVPVAPNSLSNGLDPQYWYPELLHKVVNKVKSDYNVDENKFYVAGYSMGAFGTWRYATAYPDEVAAIVPSGGNAETNTITNSFSKTAEAPFSLLAEVADKKLPVRAYAGSKDTTVPPAGAESTQSQMEKLGDSESTLTIMDTDHSGLSVGPFTADTLNWMLDQSLSGGSSSSSSSSSPSSSSSSSSGTGNGSSGSSSGSSSSKDSSSSSPSSSSSNDDTSSSSPTGSSSSSSSGSGSGSKKCRRRSKRSAHARRAPPHPVRDTVNIGAASFHRILVAKREL